MTVGHSKKARMIKIQEGCTYQLGPPNVRRGQCEGHRSLRRCKREPNRELELVQVYQSGQQYNCKTLKHDVKGHAAAGISNVENHRDTGHPGPGPGTMMISFQLLDLNSDSESLACFEFSASDSDSGSHSLPVVLATPSGSARLRGPRGKSFCCAALGSRPGVWRSTDFVLILRPLRPTGRGCAATDMRGPAARTRDTSRAAGPTPAARKVIPGRATV